MKCSLIVAVDEQGGIGKNNDLMWYLPADMKFFKETTSGHVVILGRKNYESIPERFRPLPNRLNIVISRNTNYETNGAELVQSLDAALNLGRELQPESTQFIIGGGEIYKWSLDENRVDEMYVTHVHHVFDADTFFPMDSLNEWQSEEILRYEKDEKNQYSFTIKRYWR